jgi:hypothetical protein
MYYSYANSKRSGSNHCKDDTLGTPAAPLASGTTPVAAGSVGNDTLNGVAVTDKHECYANHYGTILVDADGNVTIARIPQRDLTRLPIPSVSRYDHRVNVSPSNCTTATLTVNVVGQIIANDDTLGTPAAPLAGYYTSSSRKCDRNDTLNGLP